MKRFKSVLAIFVLALLLLGSFGIVGAQDVPDAGDAPPAATVEVVAAEAVSDVPVAAPAGDAPETEVAVSTADDVPRWFQLVLDNIEWIFGIVVSLLLYRSVPAGAFEKGLKNARESAAQTPGKDDDRLVAALEGIYGLIKGLEQRTTPPAPEPVAEQVVSYGIYDTRHTAEPAG
jgi:hypothetical protein